MGRHDGRKAGHGMSDDGPVSTEPGCLHPACVLDHPHAGPAVLAPPALGVVRAHARGAVTRHEDSAGDAPAQEESDRG